MVPRTAPTARTPYAAPIRRLALLASVLLLILSSCEGAEDIRSDTSPSIPAGREAGAASTPDCPEPVIPPGRYVTTITRADVARVFKEHGLQGREFLEELADFLSGHWTQYRGVADPNCFYTAWFTLEQHGEITLVDAHPHTLSPAGETIVLHGAGERPSEYRLKLRDGVLTFELAGADDIGRIIALTASPFVRLAGP